MDNFYILKIISIFFSFLFIFIARFSKKVVGTWLNPCSIFALFWFFYTFFPLIVAFYAPVNPFAIFYILVFTAIFSCSVLMFNWNNAFLLNARKPPAYLVFGGRKLKYEFFGLVLLAITFIVLGVINQGIPLTEILFNPISVAGEYAGKRYGSEITIGFSSQMGLQLSYIVVVLGGLVYGSARPDENKNLIIFGSFAPALLVMLIQSSKGLFFFSMFLFIAGILVTRIYDNELWLLDIKTAAKLLKYFLISSPIVFLSFLARGLYYSNDRDLVMNRLYAYLVSYSSGHLPAFSDWFTDRYFQNSLIHYNQESLTLGFYSFMSFFRIFGDEKNVPMGTYDEYFTYGEFVKTNVYSFFRGFITDFTLPGTLIFAFFLGLFFNHSFYKLLCSRFSSFNIVLFVFFVAVSYQTFVISSLQWVTIPFVFFVCWFLLKVHILILYKKGL